jgi:hypothetical protein
MFVLVLALTARPPASLPAAIAQDAVKAHVMGDPLPGRDAPAFSLPYHTAEGPGPADQPFTLRAELGRVVVLAFVPGLSDSAAVTLLRTFSSGPESFFAEDVVVASVAYRDQAGLADGTRRTDPGIKVLPDSAESVRRMYGVSRGSIGVYVVNRLGKISWRELSVNPYDKASYKRIRDAVAKALRS